MLDPEQDAAATLTTPYFAVRIKGEGKVWDEEHTVSHVVVSRGPADVIFPTGKTPRPYGTPAQAEKAATECNAVWREIQAKLDWIDVLCFLTDKEIAQLANQQQEQQAS